MANKYQNIVYGFLDSNDITLKDLSKKINKGLKDDLIERLIRRGIVDKLTQKELFKTMRATGIRFSNEQARRYFVDTKIEKEGFKKASRKASSLRGNYKFSPDAVPLIKVNTKKKQNKFLYSATIYLYSDDDDLRKYKVPKSAVRINDYLDHYTERGNFGFLSTKILSKDEVIARFIKIFTEDRSKYGKVHGSNYDDIDFEQVDVVAFKYDKTLRT